MFVIIVGGGQTGSQLAIQLINAGHKVKVIEDRPVILERLKTEDISLIVLGTQGKGFIAEIFLGSVAHNITRVAPCPILLIPPLHRGSAV